MMKFIVFLALVLAMMACLAKAQSATEVALEAVPHSRQKRASCDPSRCVAYCFFLRMSYCLQGNCDCFFFY